MQFINGSIICPPGNVVTPSSHQFIYVFDNNTDKFCLYYNEYRRYVEQRLRRTRNVELFNVALVALGLVSTALTMWTVSGRRFSSTSCVYLRFAAALELVNSLGMTARSTVTLDPVAASTYCGTVILIVAVPLVNTVSVAVVLVTVLMSIERGVACLAPMAFKLINRPKLAYGLCVGGVTFMALLYFPSFFLYRPGATNGQYSAVRTTFGSGSLYVDVYSPLVDTIYLILIAATTCTTVFATVGLLKAIRLKRSLAKRPSNKQLINDHSSNFVKLNIHLCYLQSAQASVICVNNLLTVTQRVFGRNLVACTPSNVAYYNISFEEAVDSFRIQYSKDMLIILQNATHIFAMSMSFFLYMALSNKFRSAFFERIKHS